MLQAPSYLRQTDRNVFIIKKNISEETIFEILSSLHSNSSCFSKVKIKFVVSRPSRLTQIWKLLQSCVLLCTFCWEMWLVIRFKYESSSWCFKLHFHTAIHPWWIFNIQSVGPLCCPGLENPIFINLQHTKFPHSTCYLDKIKLKSGTFTFHFELSCGQIFYSDTPEYPVTDSSLIFTAGKSISCKSSWNLDSNSNGPVFKTFTPPTSILQSVQHSLLMDAVQIFAPFLHRGRHDQMVCNDREKVSIVSIWIAPLKLDNEVLSLLLAALPSSGDDDNDGHVSASQPRIRIERHGKMWPAVCKH